MEASTQAQVLAKAGQRLHDEAKHHMRSARFHRKRAAALYEQAEELQRQCAGYGITVIFEDTPSQSPQEGQADEHHHGP